MPERSIHRFRVRAPIAVWAAAAVVLSLSGIVVQVLLPSAFTLPGRGEGLGISLPPDRLFNVGGFAVTNTLLSCWAATLLVIGLFLTARVLAALGRRGMLTAMEIPMETFLGFVSGLVGQRMSLPLFTISASAILFIMTNAWIALLPVYGPLHVTNATGEAVPLLRGAGTDINMPLALALCAGLLVQGFGLYASRLAYVERFIRVRRLLKGQFIGGMVDFFGGLFDVLLEITRVVSFTFRLFGSLTAGEILVLVISFVAPLAVVVPFYGLGLLIGAVQAWIFGSLLAVFAAAAMRPEGPDVGSTVDGAG